MANAAEAVDRFMGRVREANRGESEFVRAVAEIAQDVLTVEKSHHAYASARVLDRLVEPDRMVTFRVVWEDDAGRVRVNRGWRVQFSNALGPYKGGLRLVGGLTPSVLKFLGFEQIFKNALTELPLGGAKGGADFDPRGASEHEIMRFCHAFMRELKDHIGPDRDVPAGDMNVGTREIGWMFGAYKRLVGEFHGALTGKGETFGGSAMRVEATGYGLIYFVEAMLAERGESPAGQRIAVSGKGNVATHAAEKAAASGARVVTLSDTSGTLVAEDGLSVEAIQWVRAQKEAGADITEPPARFGARFAAGVAPWEVACDIALPCATQNEVDGVAARTLREAGCGLIAEGANMPLTAEAAQEVREAACSMRPARPRTRAAWRSRGWR